MEKMMLSKLFEALLNGHFRADVGLFCFEIFPPVMLLSDLIHSIIGIIQLLNIVAYKTSLFP